MTPKQKELLDYIRDYTEQRGYSPSYDEMRVALRLKSKSGIHRIVMALRDQGHLTLNYYKKRTVEISKKDHFLKFLERKNLLGEFYEFMRQS